MIYVIYWSGAIWPLGYMVMIPLGTVFYSYLWFVAFWNMFEIFNGVGTWKEWFTYPFWHAMLGSFIYGLGLTLAAVPVLGILSGWLLSEWQVNDYNDYGM